MLELLHELRDYLESTMYNGFDGAVTGKFYCPDCTNLIRSLKPEKLNHQTYCRLNNLLIKTISKIEELENDQRTD